LSPDADVYSELEALLNQLIKRKRLREYGMAVEETNTFADDVIRFQQRLLKNNYTELSRSEISAIYKKLY